MSSKKLGHAKSLRRRCFNLHHLDSQTEPADQAVSSTVTVHSPALSVEDTDLTEMPSKRERKSGSGTVDSSPGESGSFLGCRTQYQAAIRPSQSSSSLDSGLGLSRASSISSLPHSQRPSRESSNLADTASPLVESKRLVSVDELQSETLENDDLINKEDRKVMADKSGSVNSGILTDGEDKPNCDNNNEDDLVGRMKRFSISAVILDRLVTAVREVVADVTPHTAAAGIPKHTHLHASYSEPLTERDSPCRAPVRRHSSAGPYIPLTQGPKGQAERKRSAQPSFHRSFCNNKLEDDSESSSGKVRKTSACIMCRRKQRESTRSEPRVYIKTTPTIPGHQKKRRFSEIFKVYKPSDIPYTELRPLNFGELCQTFDGMKRKEHQQSSRKIPLPNPEDNVLLQDEQLKTILESNMPKFLQYTDWNGLYSHLISKGLLNGECREILFGSTRTSKEKGNYFYGQELPKLSRESAAYVKLFQCLDETKDEYLGHKTLFDLLSAGLPTYYYDRYCQLCGQQSETKQ